MPRRACSACVSPHRGHAVNALGAFQRAHHIWTRAARTPPTHPPHAQHALEIGNNRPSEWERTQENGVEAEDDEEEDEENADEDEDGGSSAMKIAPKLPVAMKAMRRGTPAAGRRS